MRGTGLPLAALVIALGVARAGEPNPRSDGGKAAGWKLVVDGKTADGWRRCKGEGMPDKWTVIDGALVFQPKSGKSGGDIVTVDQFDNFELVIDWKVTPGANSGIMYRVSEGEGA